MKIFSFCVLIDFTSINREKIAHYEFLVGTEQNKL